MSTAPKALRYCPAWFVQVAEAMVRSQITLKEAALEFGHQLDPDEALKISRRREFQDILRAERNKWYAAIGSDVSRSKATAIGKLEIIVDRLMHEGKYAEAAIAIEKMGKLEGWVGGESSVNVFAGLTARDIAEARSRLSGLPTKISSPSMEPAARLSGDPDVRSVSDAGSKLSN